MLFWPSALAIVAAAVLMHEPLKLHDQAPRARQVVFTAVLATLGTLGMVSYLATVTVSAPENTSVWMHTSKALAAGLLFILGSVVTYAHYRKL